MHHFEECSKCSSTPSSKRVDECEPGPRMSDITWGLLARFGLIESGQPIIQVTIHAQVITSRIVLSAALAGGTVEQRFQELSQHMNNTIVIRSC